MRFGFLTLAVLIFCLSCQNETRPKEISGAVYYWKSTYNPSEESKNTLKNLGIKKQYIRFFDIDIDSESGLAIPKGIIRIKETIIQEVVPVIYITNKTFKKLKQTEVSDLAKKTLAKIEDIANENELTFKEIQIDCDWTKTTTKAYFSFLNELKSGFQKGTKLSVTLRLHQIKFKEQTGVPPAERGTLMLYNVGDWTNVNTKNSLFDPDVIDQYIYRLPEYPLALDIALPIYQQAIVFRNNGFYTYFKNVSKLDLRKVFNTKTEGDLLICQENCEFRNHSFRKGDVFRHEKVNFKTLNKMKRAILHRIKNNDVQILLFHLDDKSLNNFTLKQYQELLKN